MNWLLYLSGWHVGIILTTLVMRSIMIGGPSEISTGKFMVLFVWPWVSWTMLWVWLCWIGVK